MKDRGQLALLLLVCLLWPARSSFAQDDQTYRSATVRRSGGRIAGVVRDPSGASVPGARVEIIDLNQHLKRTLTTDRAGHFAFDGFDAGRYQLTISLAAFQVLTVSDIVVVEGKETVVDGTLMIAPVKTDVEVEAGDSEFTSENRRTIDPSEQARRRNTAEMVADAPGVSLRANGQLASIPALHGLSDERTKLLVDGMTISSSCPNHMNPPLSYVAPVNASQVIVMAGITPVSLGGDSLGGTVSVESHPPVFAAPNEQLHQEGYSSGFYRSNGQDYGGLLTESISDHIFALGYTGAWSTNDNYTDGSGHRVTSTYAQSTDHKLNLAAQAGSNLFVADAGLHHTPYEGFTGAQMDMVRNYAESAGLRYRRSLGEGGTIDGRFFWQNTWHSMNIGKDKSTFPMPMWMPMNTHGRDLGYSAQLELALSARQTFRAGNELHRFRLDDRWPAVPGTEPYMGPDSFVSINNGRRTQLGTFAEVASRWNQRWATLLGLRNDMVWSNADAVQGYSDMYAVDAAAFNSVNRARTDRDIDLTAMARWEPNASGSFEFGYARKTRAPNLYERYAWSRNWMASGMIGWFNDGNYYVGNVALKPETANTVSGTATWKTQGRQSWQVKLTPYLTEIQHYVDVDTLGATTYGMSNFAMLRFANHNARIYGSDFSGGAALWNRSTLGQGRIAAVGGWLHGERLDTRTGLYQMMPVNVRIALDEELKRLTAGFELQAVDRKSHLDPNRFEQATPGYALFNIHAGFRCKYLQASAGTDNVLNRNYELPLGGVNFDDFMASMWMGRIKPLTGRGRSGFLNLTARF